jgi:hypothetical protein
VRGPNKIVSAVPRAQARLSDHDRNARDLASAPVCDLDRSPQRPCALAMVALVALDLPRKRPTAQRPDDHILDEL